MNIDKMLKKMVGKPKKFGGRRDLDGDGAPNRKDCQPRNTMRQDKLSTQQEYKEQIKKKFMREDPEYYELMQKKYKNPKVLKCSKCGNLVYDVPGAKYCDQCGNLIK